MKKIFRRGIRARDAAMIRRGITDAQFDIEYAMTHGYPFPSIAPTAEEDPKRLYSKAHYRTVVKAVDKVFRRLSDKVDRAVEWLNEEKENEANQQ